MLLRLHVARKAQLRPLTLALWKPSAVLSPSEGNMVCLNPTIESALGDGAPDPDPVC